MKRLAVLIVLACTAAASAASHGYTFSCWQNGWRKNTKDPSADIFGIETGYYGFTLDLADFRKAGLGQLNNPASYEQALEHKAEKLSRLPSAELLIELEVDGVRYRANTCQAGREKGVKHLSSVRLWESGRYVQHYDLLGLDLRNAEGKELTCEARLNLVAWPQSLTFSLEVSPTAPHESAVLRLALASEMGSWSEDEKVAGPWKQGETKTVTLNCPVPSTQGIPATDITVTTADDQRFPVRFDKAKNCYVASVNRLRRDWRAGYTDIRCYDEFEISVNPSGADGARSEGDVPFLLDLRSPANITGLCPLLCDQSGRPTGIPVQLSKNWHYKPMGSYLMAYTMLPADRTQTYLLRVVYGFYGTLPSASHAQLSLVGYGGHGRWDQLAIGCWGETICFDMDMSLVDVAITDIRMLMVRQGVNGEKWSWTDAGWGGDWLNIQDARQEKFFWTDLKTAYLAQGPCLTRVKYRGCYGSDREVDFSAQVQTLRTDDYSRVFQKFSYTFTRDVSAKQVWLFKLGRTSQYHTPQIAYGNRDGCIDERTVPKTLETNQLVLDHVELQGAAPWWVALPGAIHTSGRNWGTGYRALIIRNYQAVVGGNTYTSPTINAPVFRANPSNLDIELVPPQGITQFSKGDRIELDLELITLPRTENDYYGPNEAFRKHLAEYPNSWRTTYREAKGNDLNVVVTGGRVLQRYPIVIQVEEPEVSLTITGGIGAVPIRFEGLESNQGYQLYQVVNGERAKFDQSVHGNDYWQTDYDPTTHSYTMTFSLPLDGLAESEWIFAR